MLIKDGDTVTAVNNPMWVGTVIGSVFTLHGITLYVVEVKDPDAAFKFYVGTRSTLALLTREG